MIKYTLRALAALLCGLATVSASAVELRGEVWAANGPVYASAVSPDLKTLYLGGTFTSVNGELRNNIAALDLATGEVTDWSPDTNGVVRALQLSADGTVIYLGGDFTEVAGQFRNRLAALSTAMGAATTWNPGADDSVHALALANGGGSLYIGGMFTALGGVSRNWLGEVSLANGSATSWDPFPDTDTDTGTGVYALAVNGNTLYAAGDFLAIDDGKVRNRIAAFDMSKPAITDWAPQINDGSVRALLYIADSGVLYVGGDFTSVAGASQTGLVALDPANNAPLTWNPQLNGGVRALTRSFDRTLLYVGGDFTTVAGSNNIAALAVSDGAPDAGWIVDIDAPVSTLTLVNDPTAIDHQYTLYAGGEFTTVDGNARQSPAALAALPPEDTPPVTTATPAGGLHNSTTAVPIALICNDNGGSGCAATYYTTDGSEPSTDVASTTSKLYTGKIALATDMVLKFFSIDNVGNIEDVRSEIYDVELDAPLTTASPVARVFDSNSIEVTLSCDDGAGTGCFATYYTLNGSQPTTASLRYTGPITISDTVALKFFSVDVAGNAEGIKREEYAKTRGKVGAFGWYEMLALACGLCLRARCRRVQDAAR